MKIFGFIPARMGSSRYYGKPLEKILNIPMLEHVYRRANLYNNWERLFITGCDYEIKKFSYEKKFPYIATSKKHKRCLDRVFEAASKLKNKINNNDLIICVQGDEPMLKPSMIKNCIKPFLENKKVQGTVLAMDIIDKKQFEDPNIVKIIHDTNDEVLYTSRSPVPYARNFNKKIGAKRIYGIFGFRWKYLKKFYFLNESKLELIESCDSNRLCDNGRGQYIARQNYTDSFSVDVPKDLKKVERYMKRDKLFKRYKSFKSKNI